MFNTRTPSEIEQLKKEAERRVRAGENRVDVALDLGIPTSTMSLWASIGGWRKKDIAFELNEERGQAMLAKIAETTLREQEEVSKNAARAKELGEAALAAMKAADPHDDANLPGARIVPGHQLAVAMSHNLLKEGRLEEAESAARLALRLARVQQVTNDRDSARWREDRARHEQWWENYRAGFVAFHERAKEAIQELEGIHAFQNRMHAVRCCPACTRPVDFWPAEMDETADAALERAEQMELNGE